MDEKFFYRYFYKLENKKNVEIALDCFKMFLNFDSYDLNETQFKKFIKKSCDKYQNVSYHNSDHALNTLNNGVFLLKNIDKNINKTTEIVFLLACYLHDIDHPGSKGFKNDSLELEEHHVEVIRTLMNKYKDIFFEDKLRIYNEIGLLSDMIYSTNLISHDEILNEFVKKYFNTGESYDKTWNGNNRGVDNKVETTIVNKSTNRVNKSTTKDGNKVKTNSVNKSTTRDTKSTNRVIDMIEVEKITINDFSKNTINMELKGIKPEVGPLELKMLIKIADLSASYKPFETYRLNSFILSKEILGESFPLNQIDNKMEVMFLKSTSLPLIEAFSRVFKGHDFMVDNCKSNIKKLLEDPS